MKTLVVDLGERSYPIYIGEGLLEHGDLLRSHIFGHQVMIVTNETVAPLYMQSVQRALIEFQCYTTVLQDGERYKTWKTLNLIFDALLENRCDRRVTILALGGGVVGDLAGFAAASYQRGVPFIQIPTTLLAQVDSSVGGKTGINHPLGKNMIGAFHQPKCVLIDTATLKTLPERELSAGFAEVIKYGLIRDAEFLEWLEKNIKALLQRDTDALVEAIERSCRNKAEVVAADERESGLRALLNLGHTFGHAVETGVGYGEWLHGEAIAAGMCMAADLSARLGWINEADVARVIAIIRRAGLPVRAPANLSPDRLMELMAVDKKVQDGKIRLVLLKSIGEAVVTADYDSAMLRETLIACRQ